MPYRNFAELTFLQAQLVNLPPTKEVFANVNRLLLLIHKIDSLAISGAPTEISRRLDCSVVALTALIVQEELPLLLSSRISITALNIGDVFEDACKDLKPTSVGRIPTRSSTMEDHLYSNWI